MLAIAGGIVLAAFLIWLACAVVSYLAAMTAEGNPLGVVTGLFAVLATLALFGCVFG